jgi:hypothetical protein
MKDKVDPLVDKLVAMMRKVKMFTRTFSVELDDEASHLSFWTERVNEKPPREGRAGSYRIVARFYFKEGRTVHSWGSEATSRCGRRTTRELHGLPYIFVGAAIRLLMATIEKVRKHDPEAKVGSPTPQPRSTCAYARVIVTR